MSLYVFQKSITGSTPATGPVWSEITINEPYIKKVTVNFEAASVGKVGFRIFHNNLLVAPIPGIGLSQWIVPVNLPFKWKEYRLLSGPSYRLEIEVYNTDTNPVTFTLMIEAAPYQYSPVEVKPTEVNK